MEVNRLLSDELSYELQIRGLPVSSTVEEKRSVLRFAFREERDGRCSAPSSTSLSVEEELNVCSSKLLILSDEILTFNHDNRKNEFERLSARLRHVILRMDRIHPQRESHRNELANLIVQGQNLIDNLNSTYESGLTREPINVQGASSPHQLHVAQVSILDTPNPLLPEIVHPGSIRTQPIDDQLNCQSDLILFDSRPIPADHERATRSYQSPCLADFEQPGPLNSPHHVSTQIQLSPENRGVHKPNTSCPSATSNADSYNRRCPPIVRFADGERINNCAENWSRMRNVGQCSNMCDTLTSRESTRLADKLKDLNFSSMAKDDSSVDRHRYTDFSRWNVKYDGISSVNNFLDRAEELRCSRGVSKAQLLQSAAELFTRDALLWFRANKFSSWDDLVFQLREAFEPYDYENGIWEEIRRRTQGAQERVIIFIASMQQLFNRLREKPSEEAQVRLIRRNLLPYIQTQISLRDFSTIRELSQVCKSVEETEIRVQRFCPPPTNYRQLLEPELAYHKPSSTSSQYVSALSSEIAQPSSSGENTISTLSPQELNKVVCWNCLSPGHRFKKCDKPRRIFCFKCGHANVTSIKCPKCSKNLRQGQQ